MVDRDVIGVECALYVLADWRVLVAEIEPNLLFLASVQRRQADPDVRQAGLRVIALNVIGKRRLVVAVDEPDVCAIVECIGEGEVPAVQADQYEGSAKWTADVDA